MTGSILEQNIIDIFQDSPLELLGIYKERLTSSEDIARYSRWLSLSYNAGMSYLERNMHVREDSSYVLAKVKSSICFMLPYGKILESFDTDRFKVSKYALIKNYHTVIKQEGSLLIDKLSSLYPQEQFRVIVDSVPIFEKLRAGSTGTGCIGQNSLYINYNYGSFVFLGEILSTLNIESFSYDLKKQTQSKIDTSKDIRAKCKGCGKCLKACSSGAIHSEGINASECMSYLTIEHPGKVDRKYWPWFKESYFGCDRCQDICPYNKKLISKECSSSIKEKYKSLLLDSECLSYLESPERILDMGEALYKKIFKNTSFLRAGYLRLCRNILIHLAGIKFEGFSQLVWKVDPAVWNYLDKEELNDYYYNS